MAFNTRSLQSTYWHAAPRRVLVPGAGAGRAAAPPAVTSPACACSLQQLSALYAQPTAAAAAAAVRQADRTPVARLF